MTQRILKAYSSGEFHYVFGEVYAPDIVDTDGESMAASDIRKMAHDFLARGMVRALDVNHDRQSSGAVVVESFIARKGDPDFAEGSWVLGVRMTDGPLWDAVKSGELNGFSVDALVQLVPSDKPLPEYSAAAGVTLEPVEQEGVTPHTHTWYIEFDASGAVIFDSLGFPNGMEMDEKWQLTCYRADGMAARACLPPCKLIWWSMTPSTP